MRMCGGEQDADHLFACPLLPTETCGEEDFLTRKIISDKAIQIAVYWGKGREYDDRHDKKKIRQVYNLYSGVYIYGGTPSWLQPSPKFHVNTTRILSCKQAVVIRRRTI